MAQQLLPQALLKLIDEIGKLPGVGPRTAERYAYFLLREPQKTADSLAASLESLHASIKTCPVTFALISSDEERKVYDELVKTVDAYRATVSDAIAKMNEGQIFDAHEMRRSSWVKAADAVRDATDALLKINLKVAQVSFPEIFAPDAAPYDFGDWDDDEDQD